MRMRCMQLIKFADFFWKYIVYCNRQRLSLIFGIIPVKNLFLYFYKMVYQNVNP
jgi:hypothetical protein